MPRNQPPGQRWHVNVHVLGLRLDFTVGRWTGLLGFGRQHAATG